MRIKQGKSGRHPQMGIVTQVEKDEQILLGGKYRKQKKRITAQDIIDDII